jgi:hypothetical protein
VGEKALHVFLAQLADVRYSNWTIAGQWGFSAYIVNVWRKAICLQTLTLPPELRRYVVDSPIKLVYHRNTTNEEAA